MRGQARERAGCEGRVRPPEPGQARPHRTTPRRAASPRLASPAQEAWQVSGPRLTSGDANWFLGRCFQDFLGPAVYGLPSPEVWSGSGLLRASVLEARRRLGGGDAGSGLEGPHSPGARRTKERGECSRTRRTPRAPQSLHLLVGKHGGEPPWGQARGRGRLGGHLESQPRAPLAKLKAALPAPK